jgi:hypothetical protein
MRKLNVFIAQLLLSVIMLTVGIYIGRNGNQNGTIANTTDVDSIRYAIQQNALDAYSAEFETPDKQCMFQIKNGYIDGVKVFHQNGKLAINVKRGNPKDGEDYFMPECFNDNGDKMDIADFKAQYPELYKRVESLLVLDFYIR